MFKYKKMVFYLITILYIVLSLIEFIKYLFVDSNYFGLYYLIINLFIIFVLIPTLYNYKKYYSVARITKLLLIIIIGFFNSFVLEHILINIFKYTDSSVDFIHSIFIIKNILKPIIYIVLCILCFFEFQNEKVLNTKRKTC